MYVLDSHCDTPSQILRLRDLSKDNEYAHVDFPKLKRGGVDGAFFALYIPAGLDSDAEAAFAYAVRLLDGVNDTLAANGTLAAKAVSYDEAVRNRDKGLFSVFLGLENGSPIGNDLNRVKWFHDAGVRYITLCHSGNNQICDSCAPKTSLWGGLSPFGREVVKEMNRLGMLVDVSHISDASFYDVLECSEKPVVATHSCCRSLAEHPRNMTDEMIRALAASGGVIQINFYPVFLDSGFEEVISISGITDDGDDMKLRTRLQSLDRPSYKLIADHIDHVVSLVGIDHVGIGSDFDGIEVTPDGMEDISMLPVLFEELRRRGYSDSDLEKIASRNFFNAFSFSDAERS